MIDNDQNPSTAQAADPQSRSKTGATMSNAPSAGTTSAGWETNASDDDEEGDVEDDDDDGEEDDEDDDDDEEDVEDDGDQCSFQWWRREKGKSISIALSWASRKWKAQISEWKILENKYLSRKYWRAQISEQKIL